MEFKHIYGDNENYTFTTLDNNKSPIDQSSFINKLKDFLTELK
jgi:hypothetical protein